MQITFMLNLTGAHPEVFAGGGGGRRADPVTVYNLCLILKIMF
jgi:hypothetical protein